MADGKMSSEKSTSHKEESAEAVPDSHINNLIGNGEQNQSADRGVSPINIQQDFFDNVANSVWCTYAKKDRVYLIQNIAFGLFGPPTKEGDLNESGEGENVKLQGYTLMQEEKVMNIYNKIIEQKKYSKNDEDVTVSIILVVCAKPKPMKFYQIHPKDYWLDLHQKTDNVIWCSVVFGVRKCIPYMENAKSCKVYIDENARFYKSWESYLHDNTQPKCVLIVPENGEYTGVKVEGREELAVKLTVTPSPAMGLSARVLSSADTASTILSIGAIGILGATLFTPVAPAVILGATIASLSTGLYGVIRSSAHLIDRGEHEQSISLKDEDARNSWLNIAASSVGIAAGAATNMLAASAAAGTNATKTGQALALSVEVLRRMNIVTGGLGALNSFLHIILKYRKYGERPTKLELFQFTAATLFFFQSVMSNKTAQHIIEETQLETINEYKATLRSNKHRKMLDKLGSETRRLHGKVIGNSEVIQGINKISNKDDFFADVTRLNKDLNKHSLRISMTSDGHVNLNSQFKAMPAELCAMDKTSRTQLFQKLGPADLSTPNAPRLPSTFTGVAPYESNRDDTKEPSFLVNIHPGEVLRLGAFLVRVTNSDVREITSMLENLSKETYTNLMTVTFNVLKKMVPEELTKLKVLNSDKDLITQIVEFIFFYLKEKRPLGEPCLEEDTCLKVALKEFFQDGVIRQETILAMKDELMKSVEQKWSEENQSNKKYVVCKDCEGLQFTH